jgi:pimeloyl-ACP methyl ester carboxylesterase
MDAARFHAARRFLETRFGRIAYLDAGEGDAVLFLHGFPLNGFQWRGAIDRLSRERRCFAPDFLGLGYSETTELQDVAPSAQVSMLIAFLDALSIRTVDLIANDSGGAVAQLLMTHHPARIRTLLLTNCDTEIDSPPKAMLPVVELAKAGRYADAWLVPWLHDKTLARSSNGLGGLCYEDPTHPSDEAIDCYLAPLVSSRARKALTNRYAIALERNPLAGVEAALKQSRVPTRILWGTADSIFSAEGPKYLERVLGASRGVRYLDGAKLFFPEEYPDVIAEEARRLWG